jgi:23S rRNA pseudouridine2457 synthase
MGRQEKGDGKGRHCLSRLAGRQSLLHVLSAAGIGSPSRCAGMLRGGLVAVNGRVTREPKARADPFRDRVTIDGQPLPPINACRYLLVNKPYGVLCAFTDPDGRLTLADYVDVPGVYAAGRLDWDSEGLLLLTNDGWLIHRLGHPRYRHPKIYLAQVERVPDASALAALRNGVMVKGQRTAPAQATLLPSDPQLPPRAKPIRYRETVPTAWLRLVLTEGRKRQVRRMTAAVGHPTLRLVRVGIGPLALGSLQPGEWRDLFPEELEALRKTLHAPAGAR